VPKKLEHKLRQWFVYLGMIALFIIIVAAFKINLLGILVALFLITIASFSKIYKRFTSISVGFELVTPTVILFAYKMGVPFALVAAFIMLMASSFIAGKIDFPSTMVELFTYILISLLTYWMRGIEFVPLCVAMIVFRNVFMFPLGVFFLGRNFMHLFIVVVTNMFFNILIVLAVGNMFASLL